MVILHLGSTRSEVAILVESVYTYNYNDTESRSGVIDIWIIKNSRSESVQVDFLRRASRVSELQDRCNEEIRSFFYNLIFTVG